MLDINVLVMVIVITARLCLIATRSWNLQRRVRLCELEYFGTNGCCHRQTPDLSIESQSLSLSLSENSRNKSSLVQLPTKDILLHLGSDLSEVWGLRLS